MIIKRNECRKALIEYAQLHDIDVPTYSKVRTGYNGLVQEIDRSGLQNEFDIHVTDDSEALIYVAENLRSEMWVTVDVNAHGVVIYNVFDDVTEGSWHCYSPRDAVDIIVHFGIAREAMESGF